MEPMSSARAVSLINQLLSHLASPKEWCLKRELKTDTETSRSYSLGGKETDRESKMKDNQGRNGHRRNRSEAEVWEGLDSCG